MTTVLGHSLDEWKPRPPMEGPPLPEWLNIHWPWYKPPVPTHPYFKVGDTIQLNTGDTGNYYLLKVIYYVSGDAPSLGIYQSSIMAGPQQGFMVNLDVDYVDANYHKVS